MLFLIATNKPLVLMTLILLQEGGDGAKDFFGLISLSKKCHSSRHTLLFHGGKGQKLSQSKEN